MTEPTDHELLADYARTGSEAAFAQIVARHIHLVHSAARRYTGNEAQAEEITQAVFLILARKAGKLSENTVLSGWLYQTARLTAANLAKADFRRQQREQEAYMQSQLNEADAAVWRQIAPLLDHAMGKLGATDRAVLVLRFFENQTNAEAAAALGLAEGAVQKRAHRALEKLRKIFAKQGVTHTAEAIAGTVTANAVVAAPAGLALKIAALAAKGAVVSTSLAALVKGTIKVMAWTKTQTAMVVGVGVLLAVGTTTITVKEIRAHHHYSWQVPKASRDIIRQMPPQVIIVPSVFAKDGGTYRDYTTGGGVMGICQTITNIVRVAYDGQQYRMIFSTGIPDGRFDFFAKGIESSQPFFQKDLQAELKTKLGVVGKLEMRESEVLLLRCRNPNAGGLKPPDSLRRSLNLPENMRGRSETNSLYSINDSLSMLRGFLQTTFVMPVIDQTGLTNNYDFILKWDDASPIHPNKEGIKQALLDQLGLELVPTNMPVETLVIEKVK